MAIVDDAFQRNLLAGYLRLTQCVGGLHSFSSPPFSGVQRPVAFRPLNVHQDEEVLPVYDDRPPVIGRLPPVAAVAAALDNDPMMLQEDQDVVVCATADEHENENENTRDDTGDDDDQETECVTPPTMPLEPMFKRRRVTINFSEFSRLKDTRHYCSKCRKTKTKADFAQRQARNYVLLQQCSACRDKARAKRGTVRGKPVANNIRHARSTTAVSGRGTTTSARNRSHQPTEGRNSEEASDDEDTDSDQ